MRSVFMLAAASLLASISLAQAAGLPGLRGHDHTGVTVPDIAEAEAFFTDVLGCAKAMSFGPSPTTRAPS